MADRCGSWIVVGVDGSDWSVAAARWAIKEARLRAVSLHLIFVCDQRSCPDRGVSGRSALGAATHEASQTMPPGHLFAELAEGSPAQVLIDRSAGAQLLVLGTARQPSQSASEGPPFMGPVARVCLRRAACPVVVVAADDAEPFGRHPEPRRSAISPGGKT